MPPGPPSVPSRNRVPSLASGLPGGIEVFRGKPPTLTLPLEGGGMGGGGSSPCPCNSPLASLRQLDPRLRSRQILNCSSRRESAGWLEAADFQEDREAHGLHSGERRRHRCRQGG